jgi:hypothetical protein
MRGDDAMGQMRKDPTAARGAKMTEEEITKLMKDYSSTLYKPKKQPADMSRKAKRRREEEDYR